MNVINYYKEKKYDLYHKILRFAEENNESLDWNDSNRKKFCIWYDYEDKDILIAADFMKNGINTIYFSSEKLAQKAINKYGEELIEYFKYNRKIKCKNPLLNKIAKIAYENNEPLDWCDYNQDKYFIEYDYEDKKIKIGYDYKYYRTFGVIYFSSRKLVNEIINKYEIELKEYFEEHRYGYY